VADVDELMRLRDGVTMPSFTESRLVEEALGASAKFFVSAYAALPELVRELKELRAGDTEVKRIFTREFKAELTERTVESDQLAAAKLALQEDNNQLRAELADVTDRSLNRAKTIEALNAEVERLQRAAVPGNGPEMLRMQVENKRLLAELATIRAEREKLAVDWEKAYTECGHLRDELEVAQREWGKYAEIATVGNAEIERLTIDFNRELGATVEARAEIERLRPLAEFWSAERIKMEQGMNGATLRRIVDESEQLRELREVAEAAVERRERVGEIMGVKVTDDSPMGKLRAVLAKTGGA
jgi:hypothetical protein